MIRHMADRLLYYGVETSYSQIVHGVKLTDQHRVGEPNWTSSRASQDRCQA